MGVVPEQSVDLTSSLTAATRFSYHHRMAAVFAVSGELDQSGSEPMLYESVVENLDTTIATLVNGG